MLAAKPIGRLTGTQLPLQRAAASAKPPAFAVRAAVQQRPDIAECSACTAIEEAPVQAAARVQGHPAAAAHVAPAAAAAVAALAASCSAASAAGVDPVAAVADLDAATAHTLELVLRPTFTLFTMLYIVRIPMTWYPSIDGSKLPWALAYLPTEPILKATRKVIPLVGGVDVTPIVWVALLSFFSEILLGPQGLLLLIQRQGGL